MSDKTRISFIRHGQVENPNQIYYGRLPNYHLSEEGRAQVSAAGRVLAAQDVTALYHSPLLRTRQTAEILSARLDRVEPAPCELLLEVHTPYDGLTRAEMAARDWDMYTGNHPPFEQPADILRRIERFVDQALARHPGGHVLAVTHGDIIAFAILWAMGREVNASNKRYFREYGLAERYPATASITTFTVNGPDLPADLHFDYYNPNPHNREH